MANFLYHFAIIATPDGFVFAELIENVTEKPFWKVKGDRYDASYPYDFDHVVATYQNPVHCKEQIAKAKYLEKQLRPMWLAAIEHARNLEKIMTDQVYAIAKDNQIK